MLSSIPREYSKNIFVNHITIYVKMMHTDDTSVSELFISMNIKLKAD